MRNTVHTSNLDKKTGKLFARRIQSIWKLYPKILKLNKKFKQFGGKWNSRWHGMTKKERQTLFRLPRKQQILALKLVLKLQAIRNGKVQGDDREVLLKLKAIFKNIKLPKVKKPKKVSNIKRKISNIKRKVRTKKRISRRLEKR